MGRIIRASFTLIIALIIILFVNVPSFLEASGSQTNGIAFSAYPPPTTNPSPYPPPGAGFVSPTNTPYSKSLVSVSLSTIVQGLEDGNYASIKLIPGTEATQNIVKELNLNFDSTAITKDSTSTLDYKVPEGSYILQIDAPISYFREPKGYYIRISERD